MIILTLLGVLRVGSGYIILAGQELHPGVSPLRKKELLQIPFKI